MTPEITRAIKDRLRDWIKDVWYADSHDAEGVPALLVYLITRRDLSPHRRREDMENIYEARDVVAEVFRQFDYPARPHARFVTKAETELLMNNPGQPR